MTDSGQGEESQTHYGESKTISQPQYKYTVHDTVGY